MMIKMNAQDLWLNMDDDGHLTRARDDYSQATLYVHAKRFGQVLNRAEAAEAEVAALRARLDELQEQFDFLDAGHDPRSMLEEALNQVESENAALRAQLDDATADTMETTTADWYTATVEGGGLTTIHISASNDDEAWKIAERYGRVITMSRTVDADSGKE